MPAGLKILIVDDSALMRRALSEILRELPAVDIATARNGREALELIDDLNPDVVTLDVNMPVMDGLTCLSHIMSERPRPVVMVSSVTRRDSEATLEALAMGAVDIIEKPDGTVSRRLAEIGETIRKAVTSAAWAKPRLGSPKPAKARARPASEGFGSLKPGPVGSSPSGRRSRRGATVRAPASSDRLILVGVSTGGPAALETILPALPASIPSPVIVAQHMPGTFTRTLADRLDARSSLRVVEVDRLEPLHPGTVYILHGGGDGVVDMRLGRLVIAPSPSDPAYTWHPSVDRLVASALQHVPADKLLGVLLTGMGDDGARTMAELRERGGWTIAESDTSAVVFGMPRALIERGGASEIRDVLEVADRVVAWAGRSSAWFS